MEPCDVFVVHSSADADWVGRLARFLVGRGHDVFDNYSPERAGFQHGRSFAQTYLSAAEFARCVTCVMTPSFFESSHTSDEMAVAIMTGRPLIPILRDLSDGRERVELPHLYRSLHRVDARRGEDEAVFQRTHRVLLGVLDGSAAARRGRTPSDLREGYGRVSPGVVQVLAETTLIGCAWREPRGNMDCAANVALRARDCLKSGAAVRIARPGSDQRPALVERVEAIEGTSLGRLHVEAGKRLPACVAYAPAPVLRPGVIGAVGAMSVESAPRGPLAVRVEDWNIRGGVRIEGAISPTQGSPLFDREGRVLGSLWWYGDGSAEARLIDLPTQGVNG